MFTRGLLVCILGPFSLGIVGNKIIVYIWTINSPKSIVYVLIIAHLLSGLVAIYLITTEK